MIRILFLCLSLFCLVRATGFAFYPDLRAIDLEGQSLWEAKRFDLAEAKFEQLTKLVPIYGKGWFYLASTRAALGKDWKEVKPLVDRARRLEPGSGWITFGAAQLELQKNPMLTPEKIEKAIAEIQKSVVLHHPGQASPHLKSALLFLWDHFSDFEILRRVTPPDVFSYAKLMEVIEEKKLWPQRDSVYPDFLKMSRAYYGEQILKGDIFFKRGHFQRALQEYEKAWWWDPVRVPAQAGILITREKTNSLPADFQKSLRAVLEEEEEPLEAFLDRLGPGVRKAGDPYVEGLYAFRRRDFETARQMLEKAEPRPENRFRRRLWAAACAKLGKTNLAAETLRSALEEPEVDVRELFLMREWGGADAEAVHQKIAEQVTASRAADEWWGWSGETKGLRRWLDQRARMGVQVNLKPGKVKLVLNLRSVPNARRTFGYLLLRLWDGDRERRLGTLYVDHLNWKEAVFETETSGGMRWLEAELLNGREASGARRGPLVEFGNLQVIYEHEN